MYHNRVQIFRLGACPSPEYENFGGGCPPKEIIRRTGVKKWWNTGTLFPDNFQIGRNFLTNADIEMKKLYAENAPKSLGLIP